MTSFRSSPAAPRLAAETAASRVKVLEVLVEKNRVIVEGVNFVTKHIRVGQTQRGTKTGGIETFEAPIHVSNVALVDPETKKPTRVGLPHRGGNEGRRHQDGPRSLRQEVR